MLVISVTVTASAKRSAKYQSAGADVSLTAHLLPDDDMKGAICTLAAASEAANGIVFEDLNTALREMAEQSGDAEGGRVIGSRPPMTLPLYLGLDYTGFGVAPLVVNRYPFLLV
jgi:hypothetical protein